MQAWGAMPGGTNLAPHLLGCPAITGFVSYGDREPLIDGGPKRLESNVCCCSRAGTRPSPAW